MKDRAGLSIGPVFSPDAPSVSFNETPADSQAQANSAAVPLVTALYLIKTIKDTLDQVRRNAWPVISDTQGKSCSFFRLLLLIGG